MWFDWTSHNFAVNHVWRLDNRWKSGCSRSRSSGYKTVWKMERWWSSSWRHQFNSEYSRMSVATKAGKLNYDKLFSFIVGLYCCEREKLCVYTSYCWSICSKEIQEGSMPHCWTSYKLNDDARQEQWQEIDDHQNCPAFIWNYSFAYWGGKFFFLVG